MVVAVLGVILYFYSFSHLPFSRPSSSRIGEMASPLGGDQEFLSKFFRIILLSCWCFVFRLSNDCSLSTLNLCTKYDNFTRKRDNLLSPLKLEDGCVPWVEHRVAAPTFTEAEDKPKCASSSQEIFTRDSLFDDTELQLINFFDEWFSEWMNVWDLKSYSIHNRSIWRRVFPGNWLHWYWQPKTKKQKTPHAP